MPHKARSLSRNSARLILLLIITLFFVNPGRAERFEYVKRLYDAAHFPVFFGLAALLLASLNGRDTDAKRREQRDRLAVALIALVLAGVIEVLQPYTGRSESIIDFRNGVAGIIVWYGMVWFWFDRSSRTRFFYSVAIVAYGLAALTPAYREWLAYSWQLNAFPLLADFEQPIELRLFREGRDPTSSEVKLTLSADTPASAGSALRIDFPAGSFQTVKYDANDMSWVSAESFGFSLYNPGAPFLLHLRIDDDGDTTAFENRFNRVIHLPSGASTVKIPIGEITPLASGKILNLAHIEAIYLFTGEDEMAHQLYLDDMRVWLRPGAA